VKLYVEGGGTTRDEQRELREGFSKLLAKVLGDRAKPRIVACGGRAQAFAEFQTALRSARPGDLCVLLVDSEGPVAPGSASWEHVARRKGDLWVRPEGVDDDQLHFMVEAMEAWLLADPEALAAYYGQGFNAGALPGRKDVEGIAKADLTAALAKATRAVKAKGKNEYRKAHGFALIALVDPAKIEARAPRARRFFELLRGNLLPR
jgi:hypothetical protein